MGLQKRNYGVIHVIRVIIYFNPIFCSKFRWLTCCIVQEIYYFLIFHYYIIILIFDSFLEILMFSGDIYLPLDIFASLPTVSKVFYGEFFKAFVILLANLFCFFYFSNCSFWSSFKCICSRLFSMIKMFLAIFAA